MGISTVTKPSTSDLILGVNELRWCLSQRVRLQAARAAVDHNDNDQIDRFNALLADFRPRCVEYRYRKRDMEVAEGDVAQWTERLKAEGVRLVASEPTTARETVSAARRAAEPAATKYELTRRNLDERRAFNHLMSTASLEKDSFSLLVSGESDGFSRMETDAGRVECPKSLRYLDIVGDTDTDGQSESQRLLLMRDGLVVVFTPNKDGRQGNEQLLYFDIRCFRDPNISSISEFRRDHRLQPVTATETASAARRAAESATIKHKLTRRNLDERRAFNHLMSTASLDKDSFSLLESGQSDGFSRMDTDAGRVECPKSLRYLDIVDDTDADGQSESQRLLLMRDGLVVLFTPNKEGRLGSGQFLYFNIWCFRDPSITSLADFRKNHDLAAK